MKQKINLKFCFEEKQTQVLFSTSKKLNKTFSYFLV